VLAGASDGLDIILEPECNPDYVHNGERRGKSPATHGGRARVGRMARFGACTIGIEPAGAGVAYSASVFPNVHTMMRAAGFLGTLDTTVGDEKWTYTPHAINAEESATMELYYAGEKHPLAGVYAQLEIDMDIPGIPIFNFASQGLYSALPTDAAIPAITYSAFKEPAKAVGVNLTATIDATTFTVGKIAKVMVRQNRNINPRANDNTTGLHGGFNVGAERIFTMEALIEAEALTTASPFLDDSPSGFNIYELMERASKMALAFKVGSADYLCWQFAAANAQLIAAPQQVNGAAAMWNCQWELKPSSLTADDECSIIFPKTPA
jgi:hypothetical protein